MSYCHIFPINLFNPLFLNIYGRCTLIVHNYPDV